MAHLSSSHIQVITSLHIAMSPRCNRKWRGQRKRPRFGSQPAPLFRQARLPLSTSVSSSANCGQGYPIFGKTERGCERLLQIPTRDSHSKISEHQSWESSPPRPQDSSLSPSYPRYASFIILVETAYQDWQVWPLYTGVSLLPEALTLFRHGFPWRFIRTDHSRNPFKAEWPPGLVLLWLPPALVLQACQQTGLTPGGTLWGTEYQGWLDHQCPTIALRKPRTRQKVSSKSCKRHGLGGQTQSQLYPLAICNFVSYLNMNLNFHIYKIKSQTFTKDTAWCFVIKTVGFAVTA